jgi:hypothetical protein
LTRLAVIVEEWRSRTVLRMLTETLLMVIDTAKLGDGDEAIVRQMIEEERIADYRDPLREDEELARDAFRFFNEIDCPVERGD